MPGYVFVCFSVTAWHSCYRLHEPVHPLAGTDLGMKSKHSLYPPSPPVPAPASLRQLSFLPSLLVRYSAFLYQLMYILQGPKQNLDGIGLLEWIPMTPRTWLISLLRHRHTRQGERV